MSCENDGDYLRIRWSTLFYLLLFFGGIAAVVLAFMYFKKKLGISGAHSVQPHVRNMNYQPTVAYRPRPRPRRPQQFIEIEQGRSNQITYKNDPFPVYPETAGNVMYDQHDQDDLEYDDDQLEEVRVPQSQPSYSSLRKNKYSG